MESCDSFNVSSFLALENFSDEEERDLKWPPPCSSSRNSRRRREINVIINNKMKYPFLFSFLWNTEWDTSIQLDILCVLNSICFFKKKKKQKIFPINRIHYIIIIRKERWCSADMCIIIKKLHHHHHHHHGVWKIVFRFVLCGYRADVCQLDEATNWRFTPPTLLLPETKGSNIQGTICFMIQFATHSSSSCFI